MHRSVRRLLKRLDLDAETPPSDEAWAALLERLDQTFTTQDRDRYLLERSLQLSSEEMQSLNADLVASQTRLESETQHLAQALDDARAGARAKTAFLATMSHEIRTPLNGIIGMLNLLLWTELSAEQREYAETLRASSETLLSIINDILDYSKFEAGRVELESTSVTVNSLVQDVLRVLDGQARSKQLHLRSEIDPRVPPTISADPGRLKQVLLNLVGNALKFTSEGGVRVSVSLRQTSWHDLLLFEVVDTGIGIPKHRIPDLFEPFSQVDASTSRRFGGTGLGLAISRQLVEAMGGQLEVESTLDEGSTFRFEIPVHVARPATPISADIPDDAVRGLRVLVVEDNPVNRRVAVKMLERLGAQPSVAEDGAQALEVLSTRRFDVVLMDCHMPNLDGYQATRRIREEEPADERLPICALTANALPGDADACFEAGMDDYLAKPFSPQQLQQALFRLAMRRPRRAG